MSTNPGTIHYLASLQSPEREGNTWLGVELLKPGVYNGRAYTEAYVDQLAAEMTLLEDDEGYEPAYISGHTDEDEAWEDVVNDETRVLGHFGNHRVDEDGRLVADLTVERADIIPEIESGQRRYISAELRDARIRGDGSIGGPWMPLAAGVVVPANKGATLMMEQSVNLAEFPDLFEELKFNEGGGTDDMPITDAVRDALGLDADATDDDAVAAIEGLTTDDEGGADDDPADVDPAVEQLRESNETLTTRLDTAETQLAEQHVTRLRELGNATLAALAAEGHITPAQLDGLTPIAHQLAMDETTRLAELEEGAGEVSTLEAFDHALRQGVPVKLGEELTSTGAAPSDAMKARIAEAKTRQLGEDATE